MFNECIARHIFQEDRATDVSERHRSEEFVPPLCVSAIIIVRECSSYLPAADSEQESEDIGLLLLLKFFDVFEGTHLITQISACVYRRDEWRPTLTVVPVVDLKLVPN